MRPRVAFTVSDGHVPIRVECFTQVLDSWRVVDGVDDVDFEFNVEPDLTGEMRELLADFTVGHSKVVWYNEAQEGALSNPWHAYNRAFESKQDFVILAEDDSIVSSDVLRFFDQTSRHFEDRNVLCICAFEWTTECTRGAHHLHLEDTFYPTIWGTWRDRWYGLMRETWDHSYARSGWDWDIRNRIMKEAQMWAVRPCQSRSQHLGVVGSHMRAEEFEGYQSKTFHPSYPKGFFSL